MWQLYLGLAFGGILAYQVFQAIYRLTLHPLAKFPGPKIAAATRWYEFFFQVCRSEAGQFSWEIERMHEKYGPIVRVNPDEIHIKDSSYFNTIYAPSPARRDKWAPAAQTTGSCDGSFGTIDHFVHRKRRAANSALLSTKTVADAQPQVHERVKNLCNVLAERCRRSDVVQIHREILSFTTDLTTNWVLGEPWGCQENPAIADAWYATSQRVPRITPMVRQIPWIVSLALKLPSIVVKAVLPDLGALTDLRNKLYNESRKHAERRSDVNAGAQGEKISPKFPTLFDVLDRSNLPPEDKTVHRQSQEAFVLIAAGTESTARTITGCMFQLVSNPQIFARLREELMHVMPDAQSEPTLKTLESLPYLTAVLKENLRNMQLMTSRFPLQAHDDLDYKLWKIPKMVPVSMTISDVLLDENIFDEPKAFKPERWLNAEGHLHDGYQPYFVPFGKGTRSCQGQSVAWAMMYICVAQIVRRFDFSLFETTYARDFVVTRDFFLGFPSKASKGIRMVVTHDHATQDSS